MFIKTILFIHVICVATWFGGITLMAMLLRDSLRSQDHQIIVNTLSKVQRWNLTMYVPTAALVLITGMIMLFQYESKPTWLLIKERIGSLVIALFIIFITFYSRRLLEKMRSLTLDDVVPVMKKYVMWLNLFLLAMAVLFFFALVKIN